MSNKHRKLGSPKKPRKLTEFDRNQLEMIKALKKHCEENNLKMIGGDMSDEEFLNNRFDVKKFLKEKRKERLAEEKNNKYL